MGTVRLQGNGGGRVTVAEAGQLLLERLETKGRRRTTLESYESHIRVHLSPFFGKQRLDRIGRREIEAFLRYMARSGRSTKTALNAAGVLHSIFELARREGWVVANPCSLVDKPQAPPTDADIRFLEPEEIEALLRAVPDDDRGRVERPMYLAAAMTGMRQGELLALRWRDVDWAARRVRVRRSYVRGEFGPPKSRRSSRSVPLADRLAGELDLLHQETLWRGDDDLVFAHPHTGKPMDRSKLLRRFKAALAACVRCVSTTCAIRSAPGWRARACRCARCRRCSATAISRPRSSTPITRRTRTRRSGSRRRSRRHPSSKSSPDATDQRLLWRHDLDVLG